MQGAFIFVLEAVLRSGIVLLLKVGTAFGEDHGRKGFLEEKVGADCVKSADKGEDPKDPVTVSSADLLTKFRDDLPSPVESLNN